MQYQAQPPRVRIGSAVDRQDRRHQHNAIRKGREPAVTTRAEMHALIGASRQTVAALRDIGADYIAYRIERCAVGRCHRMVGRRPWTCGGPGCPWCLRTLIAGWQRTICDQIGHGNDVSTVFVPLGTDAADLRGVARAFRRAVRDLRDRAGLRRRAWRTVSAAGILIPAATGRTVVLRVRHQGLTEAEVTALVRRRWAGAMISTSLSMPHVSTAAIPLADRLSLALLRRGTEPLRIMLAAQGERSSRLRSATYIEPMPVVF